MDKWQKRQAEALAEEEGISLDSAVKRVLGTTRPRPVSTVKETGDQGKTQTPAT